jgi:hypothetical protein
MTTPTDSSGILPKWQLFEKNSYLEDIEFEVICRWDYEQVFNALMKELDKESVTVDDITLQLNVLEHAYLLVAKKRLHRGDELIFRALQLTRKVSEWIKNNSMSLPPQPIPDPQPTYTPPPPPPSLPAGSNPIATETASYKDTNGTPIGITGIVVEDIKLYVESNLPPDVVTGEICDGLDGKSFPDFPLQLKSDRDDTPIMSSAKQGAREQWVEFHLRRHECLVYMCKYIGKNFSKHSFVQGALNSVAKFIQSDFIDKEFVRFAECTAQCAEAAKSLIDIAESIKESKIMQVNASEKLLKNALKKANAKTKKGHGSSRFLPVLSAVIALSAFAKAGLSNLQNTAPKQHVVTIPELRFMEMADGNAISPSRLNLAFEDIKSMGYNVPPELIEVSKMAVDAEIMYTDSMKYLSEIRGEGDITETLVDIRKVKDIINTYGHGIPLCGRGIPECALGPVVIGEDMKQLTSNALRISNDRLLELMSSSSHPYDTLVKVMELSEVIPELKGAFLKARSHLKYYNILESSIKDLKGVLETYSFSKSSDSATDEAAQYLVRLYEGNGDSVSNLQMAAELAKGGDMPMKSLIDAGVIVADRIALRAVLEQNRDLLQHSYKQLPDSVRGKESDAIVQAADSLLSAVERAGTGIAQLNHAIQMVEERSNAYAGADFANQIKIASTSLVTKLAADALKNDTAGDFLKSYNKLPDIAKTEETDVIMARLRDDALSIEIVESIVSEAYKATEDAKSRAGLDESGESIEIFEYPLKKLTTIHAGSSSAHAKSRAADAYAKLIGSAIENVSLQGESIGDAALKELHNPVANVDAMDSKVSLLDGCMVNADSSGLLKNTIVPEAGVSLRTALSVTRDAAKFFGDFLKLRDEILREALSTIEKSENPAMAKGAMEAAKLFGGKLHMESLDGSVAKRVTSFLPPYIGSIVTSPNFSAQKSAVQSCIREWLGSVRLALTDSTPIAAKTLKGYTAEMLTAIKKAVSSDDWSAEMKINSMDINRIAKAAEDDATPLEDDQYALLMECSMVGECAKSHPSVAEALEVMTSKLSASHYNLDIKSMRDFYIHIGEKMNNSELREYMKGLEGRAFHTDNISLANLGALHISSEQDLRDLPTDDSISNSLMEIYQPKANAMEQLQGLTPIYKLVEIVEMINKEIVKKLPVTEPLEELPEVTETPETPETLEVSEILEPFELSEPLEVHEPIEVSEPLEVPEPIEVSEPLEVPETIEVSEALEVPEAIEVSEPLEVPEPMEQTVSESLQQSLQQLDDETLEVSEPLQQSLQQLESESLQQIEDEPLEVITNADGFYASFLDIDNPPPSLIMERLVDGMKSGRIDVNTVYEVSGAIALENEGLLRNGHEGLNPDHMADYEAIRDFGAIHGTMKYPGAEMKLSKLIKSEYGRELYRLVKNRTHAKASSVTTSKAAKSGGGAVLEKRTQYQRRAKDSRAETHEILALISPTEQSFVDAIKSMALGEKELAEVLSSVGPFLEMNNDEMGMTIQQIADTHNESNQNSKMTAVHAKGVLSVLRFSSHVPWRTIALTAIISAFSGALISQNIEICKVIHESSNEGLGLISDMLLASADGFTMASLCVNGGVGGYMAASAAVTATVATVASLAADAFKGKLEQLKKEDELFLWFMRWERLRFLSHMNTKDPRIVMDAIKLHKSVRGEISDVYLNMYKLNWRDISNDKEAFEDVCRAIQAEEDLIDPEVWETMKLIFP